MTSRSATGMFKNHSKSEFDGNVMPQVTPKHTRKLFTFDNFWFPYIFVTYEVFFQLKRLFKSFQSHLSCCESHPFAGPCVGSTMLSVPNLGLEDLREPSSSVFSFGHPPLGEKKNIGKRLRTHRGPATSWPHHQIFSLAVLQVTRLWCEAKFATRSALANRSPTMKRKCNSSLWKAKTVGYNARNGSQRHRTALMHLSEHQFFSSLHG